MKDLRPYLCTYDQCDTGNQLYDSMEDWLSHEAQMHQANVDSRQCPFCPETSNAHHIAAHFRRLAFFALPMHFRRLAFFALPRSNDLEQSDEVDDSNKAHQDLASDNAGFASSSLALDNDSLAYEEVKHEPEASPITSRWSLGDQTIFTACLRRYGRDWSRIATNIETKTPLMVNLSFSNASSSQRITFN